MAKHTSMPNCADVEVPHNRLLPFLADISGFIQNDGEVDAISHLFRLIYLALLLVAFALSVDHIQIIVSIFQGSSLSRYCVVIHHNCGALFSGEL